MQHLSPFYFYYLPCLFLFGHKAFAAKKKKVCYIRVMLTNRRVVLAVSSAAIAAAIGSGYWYYQQRANKSDQQPTSGASSPTQLLKKSVADAPADSVAASSVALSEVQQKIKDKDLKGAVEQSKKIYDNTSAPYASRMQALTSCITAAKAAGDQATMNTCKDKANQLLNETPANMSDDEKVYYAFLIKYALGEAKLSDYEGYNAGR